MNIAIVDDLEEERGKIKNCLDTYAHEKRVELDLHLFESADDFLEGYQPLQYTLVFMDIFMPGRTGIEAAEEIRKVDSDTIIVFLTDSMDYMPEAFNCHAYDYIKKPAMQDKIDSLMDELRAKAENNEKTFIFICEHDNIEIPYGELVSICSSGHYLEIAGKDGTVYKTRLTFQQASQELESDNRFLLINRGILVNMDYILSFSNGMCQLAGGISMPANVRNSKSIENIWHNYLFTKMRNSTMERSSRR